MAKVNWTRQAIDDLYETREYYGSRSIKYAEELTNKIFEKEAILEQHPMAGRMVPELEKHEIRELIYKNYRIIYHVVSIDRIDVLAVHTGSTPLTEESIFG